MIDAHRIRRLPEADLRAALEDADFRVLLMVVCHLSGDTGWLREPYLPGRDINLIADEAAGLSDAARADIVEAAVALLTHGAVEPKIVDPGNGLMHEMMCACLGQRVGTEYAPMMREEVGFVPRLPRARVHDGALKHPILIAGAGPSGIMLAAHLKAMGLPFIVFEKNEDVGGAWFENRYPGCAVDTPNHAYSFSFGPREGWTRYFSRRDALQSYLVDRSHLFGIRDDIRFGATVRGCTWDAGRTLWQVEVDGPCGREVYDGAAVVSCIGPISVPSIPAIPGRETFGGALFHSARWPEGLNLAGKRVAVVGTGASSMQIVPSIAAEVATLDIYQRTPQWVRNIPRFQDDMTPGARWLLEHVPFYAEWFRLTMLWRYGDGLLRTVRRDPDWPHPERAMNAINDRHRVQMTDHIEAELAGRPDLLDKCLPGYPPYAKRILLDNGWYRTLRREGVSLITDGIERLTPKGIVAGGVERPVEFVVMATGFEVFENAAALNVRGRDGVGLAEVWANKDPTAHLGITVPGFPNFFCMQGPNTVLAHGGSAIFTSECQARYILKAILHLSDDIEALEVRRDVHDAYMASVDVEHRELVWNHPGVTPWYRNPKGRVAAAIPWRLVDYWAMTRAPDLDEFQTTRRSSADQTGASRETGR